MTNVFFTADQHFDHDNIRKYCNRPFDSVEEMNETIIELHNEVVRPGDVVYHLGDIQFTWGKNNPLDAVNVSRLNGQHYLIRGNHDRLNQWSELLKKQFIWIREREEVKFKGIGPKGQTVKIIMDHFPLRSWNAKFHGSLHLFGHVHGGLEGNLLHGTLDVGVDVWGFRPISLEEVLEAIDIQSYWAWIEEMKSHPTPELIMS